MNKKMEIKKQTAVDYLIEKVKSSEWQDMYIWHKEAVFAEAKEMERIQSIDDFTCGSFEGYKGANGFPSMLVEDYINKKYKQ
jgi:hypothetical protein